MQKPSAKMRIAIRMPESGIYEKYKLLKFVNINLEFHKDSSFW